MPLVGIFWSFAWVWNVQIQKWFSNVVNVLKQEISDELYGRKKIRTITEKSVFDFSKRIGFLFFLMIHQVATLVCT